MGKLSTATKDFQSDSEICGFIEMKLLTVKELSEITRVKESTLYYWASNGLIPSLKLNGLLRFDQKEIEEWIRSSKIISDKHLVPIKPAKSRDIEALTKKIIDREKAKSYNRASRKPGQRKEA